MMTRSRTNKQVGLRNIIMSSIINNKISAVSSLIKAGTVLDINMLEVAVCRDHLQIVSMLLQNGVDPNKQSNDTFSLLHTTNYRPRMMLELLRFNADPNVTWEPNGETPLFESVRAGEHPNTLILLLAFGANPNIKNKFGDTVLLQAISDGRWRHAMILLAFGAKTHDVTARQVWQLSNCFLLYHYTKKYSMYQLCTYLFGRAYTNHINLNPEYIFTGNERNDYLRWRDHGFTLQETAAFGLKIAKIREKVLTEIKERQFF